ncbi:MAG: hypothetical protein WDW36_001200 [Sanguina aurantia]
MREAIWEERMNPLSLVPERFCIAELDTAVPPGGQAQPATGSPKADVKGSGSSGIVALGQLQAQGNGIWELRSLVVDAACRGKGVGSGLVRELLRRVQPGDVVFLTTIGSRTAFYERLGFSLVPPAQVPRFLWVEVVTGTAVARLVAGERLVVMGK